MSSSTDRQESPEANFEAPNLFSFFYEDEWVRVEDDDLSSLVFGSNTQNSLHIPTQPVQFPQINTTITTIVTQPSRSATTATTIVKQPQFPIIGKFTYLFSLFKYLFVKNIY